MQGTKNSISGQLPPHLGQPTTVNFILHQQNWIPNRYISIYETNQQPADILANNHSIEGAE
jgi:hypothetical protein